MSAREDYPTIARRAEVPSDWSGECRLALNEIDGLRERVRVAEADAEMYRNERKAAVDEALVAIGRMMRAEEDADRLAGAADEASVFLDFGAVRDAVVEALAAHAAAVDTRTERTAE